MRSVASKDTPNAAPFIPPPKEHLFQPSFGLNVDEFFFDNNTCSGTEPGR
jgi:hypothetical protein